MRPEDERVEELLPAEQRRPNAPVFAVAPVEERGRVPRGAIAGIAIVVLAFVAGIGVASAGHAPGPARSAAVAAPAGSAGPPTSAGPGTTPDPSPAGPDASAGPGIAAAGPDAGASAAAEVRPAGSSDFVARFDPVAIVTALPGGKACTSGPPRQKEVPRTRRDGPRLTFQRSWVLWCPVPVSRRQAFLLGVFDALGPLIPADTYGYSATDAGGGDALYPYADYPLAGTVAVTADAAATGFAIAFVLEEWRPDSAP